MRQIPGDQLKRNDPEMFQIIYDEAGDELTVVDYRDESADGDYTFWVHYEDVDIQVYRSLGKYHIGDPVNKVVENGNKRDVVQVIISHGESQ